MAKIRADILLQSKGLCASREQAKTLILAGKVRLGADHVVRKAAEGFPENADLRVVEDFPYVSRGASKLLPALEKHLPDPSGLVALDIGASTGGFTDLMLQKGVEKVYAVDVGHGQLHLKLRNDSRVICHERVNARHLAPDFLPEAADILTMDVSFISVRKILPAVNPLLKLSAWAFILIKPQFEAERHEIAKGGVVRDENVRQRCVDQTANFAIEKLGWTLIDQLLSPVTGPKGNREFMLVLRKNNH